MNVPPEGFPTSESTDALIQIVVGIALIETAGNAVTVIVVDEVFTHPFKSVYVYVIVYG